MVVKVWPDGVCLSDFFKLDYDTSGFVVSRCFLAGMACGSLKREVVALQFDSNSQLLKLGYLACS